MDHTLARNTSLVHPAFRPDIEALRGVAVLAVVFYHAAPTIVPGGFLGVDVFFVISGYLITQLLLRELDSRGSIDLAEFWARRIRRIAPAAICVLLAIAAALFIVPDFNGRLIGRHIVAAALSYYNWRQISQGVDYLAHDDSDNPVLHYWSLSVEEQFYFVWPLMLLALALSVRRELVVLAVTSLAIVSLALAIRLAPTDPSLAFFGTGTRAWQLLIGALAAMAPPLTDARTRSGLQALGLVGTAIGIGLAGGALYRPAAAIAPTLGAAALLYAGLTPLSAALAVPPLAIAGRISFSLYLWHWPLLVFLPPTLSGTIAALVLALVASVASYRFVEQPARKSAFLARSRAATYAFGGVLIGSAVLVGFGLRQYGPDTIPIIYDDECLLGHPAIDYADCAYGVIDSPRVVVLFGDSHAGNWFNALEQAALHQGWRLLVRVKAACGPVDRIPLHTDGRPYPECATWRNRVLDEIRTTKPALIVVSGMTGGKPAGERVVLETLGSVAPTLAVRDTPKLPMSGSECLRPAQSGNDCSWPLADLRSKAPYPTTPLQNMPPNVSVLDLSDRICPRGQCSAMLHGRLVMFDKHHLTESFSTTLADEFEPFMR